MSHSSLLKLKSFAKAKVFSIFLVFLVLCVIKKTDGLYANIMSKHLTHSSSSSPRSVLKTGVSRVSKSIQIFSQPNSEFNDSSFNSDNNEETKTTSEGESIQGYVSSDIRNMGSGKQVRVLLYISLALLPCLLLIPFFMNRDFLPPIDADMMIK